MSLSIKGLRSGNLVAVCEAGVNKHGRMMWKCQCDCGGVAHCTAYSIVSGGSTSCGCRRKKTLRAIFTTHGHTTGHKYSPTYSSWTAMIARCTRPSQSCYARYGGRGITVCERWMSFERFLADMGERPSGMTLDRFPNPNGNYEPGNCRWATRSQQNMNKECNPHFEINGKRMTLRAWAAELGVDRSTLQKRIYKLGWPIEMALSPILRGRWGIIAEGKRPGNHSK